LCCQCGIPITPNPANMCVACLRTQVDITEGIPKQVTVHFCKQCERYLQPPGTWVQCALESRELLTLCLKKIKASLSKVRLIEASFVWTEPHSRRLKIKLTVQKEVMNGAILQQVFVVEYVVQPQMCDDCHRVEAKDFWKAVVQVRQKDNVVCLSPKLAQSLGNMSQICVCIRVTSTVHLIDPNTLQIADIDGNTFWRHPFNSLFHPKQLEEFIVIDITRVQERKQGAGAGMRSNKVLIKKSYDRTKRQRRRNWKLKELERDREGMDTDDERQYQDFLEDLEEDEAIRRNVNIYKDSRIPVESDTDDEGAPRISLAEMLEELHISQDATGGEGSDMMTQ
ncbi:60S ribosomal export protein NMD3, partial [Chelonia mydas]